MIRNVADFLDAFKAHHLERMPSFKEIEHPGIFGSMYEGLTQAILSRAVPKGDALHVVTGKIRNSQGTLSRQLDCMIVLGDGERVPFTDCYIYPVDRVLMIVEVKKTLMGEELSDAMDLFQHFWASVSEAVQPKTRLLGDAWRGITGTHLPEHSSVGDLPIHLEMLYHTLLIESYMPLRVIVGYEGYKDEWTLREGFYNWFYGKGGNVGPNRYRLNLNTFPNLVICGQSSIVKLDGLPYSTRIRKDGFLCWLGSRGSDPMISLLEMLWTRLAPLSSNGPEIFGDDLDNEGINPFIFAKASKGDIVGLPEKTGWMYDYIPLTRAQLLEGNRPQEWKPVELTSEEATMLTIFGHEGQFDLADPKTLEFFKQNEVEPGIFAEKLSKGRLATLNGNTLELLIDEFTVSMLPDGRNLAADNKTGRLTRYLHREAERKMSPQDS